MAPSPWETKRLGMVEPTSDSNAPTFEGKQSGEVERNNDGASRMELREDGQYPGTSIQETETHSNDQQAAEASRATVSSHREEGYSSRDDDSGQFASAQHRSSEDGAAAAHHSSDDGIDDGNDDDESRQKREKRLAMNRASARERRRRKRVHTEELEQRVIALSRQCSSLQKTNEGLRLYVSKLESNLAQANATITILGKNDASLNVPPLERALLPPVASRQDPLASSMQEQDRIRGLLNMIQHPEQASATSRLNPGIAGRLPQARDEDVQRQVMLDMLSRQQHMRPPPDAGLASLVASHAGSNREPPMDPTIASLLGRTAPPPVSRGGDHPALASYLSALQRSETNPLRMLDFAASGAGRGVNDSATLHSAIGRNASAPPKKRRKEYDE